MAKQNTGTAVHTQTIKVVEEANKNGTLKKDPAGVMVNIIKQQRSIYAKEIKDWLAARMAAENVDFPQRGRLYDIYDDMVLDDFVHGQMYNHRILPVKNRAFKIVDAEGKKDDDKTKLLQKRWFDNFITLALESKFYGFSLAYLNDFELKDGINQVKTCDKIPVRHVLQEKGFVLAWQSDFIGKSFVEEPVKNYVLPIGNTHDLGLLNKAVPLWILKKHSWQNWDEFAEIFGIPIRIVKTSSDDSRVRNEIEGWVRDMGSAAYGIFPEGTDIEIKENNKTDAFKVFAEMIKSANEGLAFLFSGQTMTSMNGSSRSQAEVHQEVATEIRKDDEKFIGYEVQELIDLLRNKHGYPFTDGDRFEWDVPEDVEGLMAVFKAVNEFGFQLDAEEVSTRLGIKIVGIKSVAAADPGKEPGADPAADPAKKDATKKEDEKNKEELTVAEILKLHAQIAQTYTHK